MSRKIRSRKIELSSDEFFILVGLMALNMKDFKKFIKPFEKYKRIVKMFGMVLSEPIVDEILDICMMHGVQEGMTQKTINKIKMTKECMIAEKNYEKKISEILDSYKDKISNKY